MTTYTKPTLIDNFPFPSQLSDALAFVLTEVRAGHEIGFTHAAELFEAMRQVAIAAGRDDHAEALWHLLEPLNDIAVGLLPDGFRPANPKQVWSTRKTNLVVNAMLALDAAAEAKWLERDAISVLLSPMTRKLPWVTGDTVANWRGQFQRITSKASVAAGAIDRYERMKAVRERFGATPEERFALHLRQVEMLARGKPERYRHSVKTPRVSTPLRSAPMKRAPRRGG